MSETAPQTDLIDDMAPVAAADAALDVGALVEASLEDAAPVVDVAPLVDAVPVADTVDYAPFETPEAARPAPSGVEAADLERLSEVPVELAVEIGRTRMTIGETLNLGPGSIVTLNRLAGEPVDLLVNGKPIARGEVVVIDEEFGLRITELASADDAGPAGPVATPQFTATA
jgi:flagellar motor switch protein FliN/FliY